jgi:pimeloyl-ACP methyl ester carboxylesterase
MAWQAMQRTKINGVELELRDRGSGEPVVFVHGAMGDECAAVLVEPALPSVLGNSQAFSEIVVKAAAMYRSGDKAGAIETFGQEVGGVDFRAVFDQTLPPGSFERWVADADTIFRSELPALQPWQFTRQDAARIAQPVLNLRGANTRSYFQEIHETLRTWLPHAENFELPNATHSMLQTNPKGAAECLVSFFSRHRLQGNDRPGR